MQHLSNHTVVIGSGSLDEYPKVKTNNGPLEFDAYNQLATRDIFNVL
jgi:hypothetical protein